MLKNLHEAAGCPLGKQTEGPDAKGTATELAALSGLAPFTYGLEYSAPAREAGPSYISACCCRKAIRCLCAPRAACGGGAVRGGT